MTHRTCTGNCGKQWRSAGTKGSKCGARVYVRTTCGSGRTNGSGIRRRAVEPPCTTRPSRDSIRGKLRWRNSVVFITATSVAQGLGTSPR
eukprot:8514806-Pyramimonas_sp.AAC.1